MRHRMFEMTSPEVREAIANGFDTVIVPFGATEQHGPHLPLGTDSIIGAEIGDRVARKLGNALLAPTMCIGLSEHHMKFAGSITLGASTFAAVVHDYCTSLARHGFKHIVLIPSHGGNFAPIQQAAQVIRPTLPDVQLITVASLDVLLSLLHSTAAKNGISAAASGAHAGENETSMMLAFCPQWVKIEKAQTGFIGDFLKVQGQAFADGIKAISANGVLGDPLPAKASAGETYLQAWADWCVEVVQREKK